MNIKNLDVKNLDVRNRTALVAAATALAVAGTLTGLATGAQAAPHEAGATHVGLAASTTDSSSRPAAALRRTATRVGVANLPSAHDIVVPGHRAITIATIRGHWDVPTDLCRTHPWSDLGSTAEFTRDFATNVDARTDEFAEATIASFGSHEAATRAARRMAGSLDCAAVQEKSDYRYGSGTTLRRTMVLPGGQTLYLNLFTYRSTRAPHMLVSDSIGVVATGTRTELVEVESLVAPGHQGMAPMVATIRASLPALRR